MNNRFDDAKETLDAVIFIGSLYLHKKLEGFKKSLSDFTFPLRHPVATYLAFIEKGPMDIYEEFDLRVMERRGRLYD
jgi:hypothetical protein